MYSVLIVEDDPMVAMINEQYVKKNPAFSVAGKCQNGEEAFEFLSHNKVDLVILDVYMPYMDGIKLLQKIRAANIQTEAVMVTAANDAPTLEQTMHMGVIDYLVKPFAYERFQIALEKFCAKKTALTNASVLSQQSIDSIISASRPAHKDYPKGIQEKTLTLILENLGQATTWLDGESIAKNAGLSTVTVRRYMNYMVSEGLVTEEINYETVGRPRMLYKKK